MTLRDEYHIPRGPHLTLRMFAVMLIVPALVLALWLIAPGGWASVALVGVLILLAVGVGVFVGGTSRPTREPRARRR